MMGPGKIVDCLLTQELGVAGKTDFAYSHKVTISDEWNEIGCCIMEQNRILMKRNGCPCFRSSSSSH